MKLRIMSSKISQTQTKSCFLSYTESRFKYIYTHMAYICTHIHTYGRAEGTISEKKGFKGRTREDIRYPTAFWYSVKHHDPK